MSNEGRTNLGLPPTDEELFGWCVEAITSPSTNTVHAMLADIMVKSKGRANPTIAREKLLRMAARIVLE